MPNCVLTIGNFDGVHLGHQKVIHTAIEQAQKLKLPSTALTFTPHPEVFFKNSNLQFITTYQERRALLNAQGLGQVIELAFDEACSQMTAQEFFDLVIKEKYQAQALVVGYDFAFGKKRSGNIEFLKNACQKTNILFTVVEGLTLNGQTISSSEIRLRLTQGDIEGANEMLGFRFFYDEQVIKGDGRGKTIGFPTINSLVPDKILLPLGVYVTQATLNEKKYQSVTNIGVRPTFKSETNPHIETHLIDYTEVQKSKPAPFTEIKIEFLHYLRPEQKFKSVNELCLQIQQDKVASLRFFKQT